MPEFNIFCLHLPQYCSSRRCR